MMSKTKIVPMGSQSLTALGILSSPEDLLPLATLQLTASNLHALVDRFLLTSKSIDESNVGAFVSYLFQEGTLTALEEGRRANPATAPLKIINNDGKVMDDAEQTSSVVETLANPSQKPFFKRTKVVPVQTQQSSSTALSILSSPEATSFIKNYNKDLEFENEKIVQMTNVVQMYSPAEEMMIASALGLIEGMKMKGAIPFKEFKATFSSIKYLRGFYNLKSGDIYQEANFSARGNHTDVAARITNYWNRFENPAFGASKETNLENESYIEVPNGHSSIYCQPYNFPSPLTDREAICNIVWKRISNKSIMASYHPLTHHPKVEDKDGKSVIRASFHAVYCLTQLDDGTTDVQMGFHINFGGHLPKAIVNGFIIPSTDRVISKHLVYFANSLTLDNLKEADGKLLGEILVNQIKKARTRGGWKKRADLGKVGVDEFLYISAAMRQLLPLHPWFRALLHEISLNQVKGARTVATALSDMKDHDAINLAKGMSTIVLSNTEAPSAVDHWIAQNLALEEFEKEHQWMRSFFVEIAQYNLNTSNFGLRLRVFDGALLSTIDLITDIYMTVRFFNTEGQEGYGMTNAWLIGLTMFFQIIVAYVQNGKKPSSFFHDLFCILTGFKPALDAYRVGSGAEKQDHHHVSPLEEMSYCKITELVFEAVPAAIVQIYALLIAKEQKLDALISIMVSAATIGFTSAMLSYDWDTSPTQRAKNPGFYGYIPDKALSRAACFLSMMSLSFAHVLLQTLSCALLFATNPRWLVYYLAGDIGLFLLYKVARRDFYYWLNVSGVLRFFSSFIVRFGAKIMVNFTLLIHLRHPGEAGSFPFLVSVLLSVAASFVSVQLYSNHYKGDDKIDDERLQAILSTLYGVWFISLVTFVAVIKREYLHTFYSFDTLSDFNRKLTLNLRDDQEDIKCLVLEEHPDTFSGWGEELLKPWTLKNWARWEEEKPAWFTDTWIESVPNEYVP
ncbi:hypothetical protein TrVE_jg4853 [Triparma verrucosa]|uniref:Uncharacterized protein n=1 Tax=Triparma verrucosa TaxID=1606542 RepID=A0A9W6Z9T3_9STRA|nr:hypothetical protein TrVE_jg4853 [Triparma verrucosa]